MCVIGVIPDIVCRLAMDWVWGFLSWDVLCGAVSWRMDSNSAGPPGSGGRGGSTCGDNVVNMPSQLWSDGRSRVVDSSISSLAHDKEAAPRGATPSSE